MCFETLSFYLLEMVSEKTSYGSEKITGYGKREKLLSWRRDSWISSFSVFIVGHATYQE